MENAVYLCEDKDKCRERVQAIDGDPSERYFVHDLPRFKTKWELEFVWPEADTEPRSHIKALTLGHGFLSGDMRALMRAVETGRRYGRPAGFAMKDPDLHDMYSLLSRK